MMYLFRHVNHILNLLYPQPKNSASHFSVMAFIIGLPVAQIILFCLAVGHDPEGLKLAIVNNELSDKHFAQQECPIYEGCNYTMLSCRYLDFLKNRSIDVVSIMRIVESGLIF